MNEENMGGGQPRNAHIRGAGIAFVVIGFLAILVPVWASFATEMIVALMFFFWGILGCALALSLRPMEQWRPMIIAFGLMLVAGLVLIVFPLFGVEVLTILLMFFFMIEGIGMVVVALQVRQTFRGWGWLLFSGACAALLGLLVLLGAYGSGAPILGLFVGLNFLTSGASLIMISNGRDVP